VTGHQQPLVALSALIGGAAGQDHVRRVPGAAEGRGRYVAPCTNNSTRDDGGFIDRVLDTPALADSAAVKAPFTYHSSQEPDMSVRARGASVHPNTPSRVKFIAPLFRRTVAAVTR
jgi:hypothetical protein